MALVQALIALIGRSTGKILYAVFGWAVRALFGYTSGARRTLLTALVAIAALWPLLAIGVAAPRVAAFALAFVPIPDTVSDAWIRGLWIALAIVIPTLVGIALATQAPAGAETESESVAKRVLRGYPITLGISAAFWLSFVSVPVQRLVSWARGQRAAYIPLVTSRSSYEQAARRVERVLDDHGFELQPTEPGFWTRAPMRLLRALGGAALRDFVPEQLAYFEGPRLVVALHPSGVLLRGDEDSTALAHGLAAESLTACDAYQTTDPDAQRLERQIHRVLKVFAEDPVAHRDSQWLRGRLDAIASELTRSTVPYDDWQIVYRQLLQLARALGGEPQILSHTAEKGDEMASENWFEDEEVRDANARFANGFSTRELLREITAKAALLARKEMELARVELKHDFASEVATVKALAVAAVFAITTLNLLLVAAVFALTPYFEGWLAAIVVAGATLLVAAVVGAIGWSRRVTRPLERTRRTIAEDMRWAKERLA